jgi:hypothetical protein
MTTASISVGMRLRTMQRMLGHSPLEKRTTKQLDGR